MRERRIPDAPDKDPGEQLQIALSFFAECGNFWARDKEYAADAAVLPNRSTGYAYETTAGGMSGAIEPKWPTAVGATVQDGSITWTCATVSSSGAISALSNVSATIEPAGGLTIASVGVDGVEPYVIDVTYAANGVHGCDYDAVFNYSVAGVARVARQKVRVRRQ